MHDLDDHIAAVRQNVPMYLGGTDLRGYVHYFICPVALLLAHGAREIHVNIDNDLEVQSDTVIEITQAESGKILPFQEFLPRFVGDNFKAVVFNALSQELSVSVQNGSRREELCFSYGALVSRTTTETQTGPPGTTLRFTPDGDIFLVTDLSPTALASYFRRLSYLHEGVRFTLTVSGVRQEYFAPNGIADLFAAIAAPYPIMHEPISIMAQEGELSLKVVLAYQSWKEDYLQCFVNGCTMEGGTHEEGLVKAIKRLKRKLDLPEDFRNGVVAVASFWYPRLQWGSSIKAIVSNPELKPMVSRLVVNGTVRWLEQHPEVEAQIRKLQTFAFPAAWFSTI